MGDLTERRPEAVQLPAGEPEEQIVAILDRPDAASFVAAIEAPTLYRLVLDAGWDVGQELVPYLTPQQLQTCLDFDCWTKGRFLPEKVAPWLAALVAEADDATFRRQCREMEPEVLAIFVQEYLWVDVFGEEGEVPLHFADEMVERSPDGVYALVYRGDDSVNALIRAALNRLYELDMVLAWTLLEAARWELRSAMEEEALRWRTSRLEEWGFVDLDEAMEIYKPLDGAKYRERLERGEVGAKRPAVAAENIAALAVLGEQGRGLYAARILARLSGQELETAMAEFVALQNRASIAEGIDPGDRGDVEAVAERTAGYLSIGLEFLSRRDDERAADILRTAPLRDVFRVGFTTVDRLRDHVHRIRRRPTLSLIEGERFSLLRGADAALGEALANVRPQYAALDGTREIFSTQAQVDDAAFRLGLIAFKQLWLFGVLGAGPAELAQRAHSGAWLNEPPELTFDAFFAAAVAQVLVGLEPDGLGLAPSDLPLLLERIRARPWADDLLATFEPLVGPALERLGPGGRLMTRWLEATLAELVDELGGVSVAMPEILTGLLLLRAQQS